MIEESYPIEWKRNGYTIAVSPEMLDDIIAGQEVVKFFNDGMHRAIDKMQHPWRYPDPPAIRWTFDPFPRVTPVLRWLEDHRPRRWRHLLAGAVGDLAYKIDATHPQWGDEWS